MFEFVKDIFRKSSLKKNASTVETGFLPLNRIRSYVGVNDNSGPRTIREEDDPRLGLVIYFSQCGVKCSMLRKN